MYNPKEVRLHHDLLNQLDIRYSRRLSI
jgi:hypothetical protein